MDQFQQVFTIFGRRLLIRPSFSDYYFRVKIGEIRLHAFIRRISIPISQFRFQKIQLQ